ncbi:MAG TPA: DUF3299 domain-containing protein [Candidatus Sumerlaeota bacterium]|nr:DUF3299 domain-containing protein [Candidatus Sumerlaeota bacterium]
MLRNPEEKFESPTSVNEETVGEGEGGSSTSPPSQSSPETPVPSTGSGLSGQNVSAATPVAETRIPTSVDFTLLDKTEADEEDASVPPRYPPEISQLADHPVRIRGFMVPFKELNDMRRFVLMPTQVGCFFCNPPSVTQVALVRQKTQTQAPYIDGPIEVEGILRLWQAKCPQDPEREVFLYILDAATARPVKPRK